MEQKEILSTGETETMRGSYASGFFAATWKMPIALFTLFPHPYTTLSFHTLRSLLRTRQLPLVQQR